MTFRVYLPELEHGQVQINLSYKHFATSLEIVENYDKGDDKKETQPLP